MRFNPKGPPPPGRQLPPLLPALSPSSSAGTGGRGLPSSSAGMAPGQTQQQQLLGRSRTVTALNNNSGSGEYGGSDNHILIATPRLGGGAAQPQYQAYSSLREQQQQIQLQQHHQHPQGFLSTGSDFGGATNAQAQCAVQHHGFGVFGDSRHSYSDTSPGMGFANTTGPGPSSAVQHSLDSPFYPMYPNPIQNTQTPQQQLLGLGDSHSTGGFAGNIGSLGGMQESSLAHQLQQRSPQQHTAFHAQYQHLQERVC